MCLLLCGASHTHTRHCKEGQQGLQVQGSEAELGCLPTAANFLISVTLRPHFPCSSQDATDDLQRIMAELAALEEAAGMNRSAAGGGGAASSDYCEGAEVSELE